MDRKPPLTWMLGRRGLFGRQLIVLAEPLIYMDVNRNRAEIPAGFVSDGASVPPPVSLIYPPFGEYLADAIAHDWRYWLQMTGRKVADRLFYEAMLENDVPPLRARLIYAGARIGGWWGWWKNRRNKEAGKVRVLNVNNPRWWIGVDADVI